MAWTVTRVGFKNADTAVRKGFVRAIDKMVNDMLGQQRSGDALEIEMVDDAGNVVVQDYRFAVPTDASHPHKKSHIKAADDSKIDFYTIPGAVA